MATNKHRIRLAKPEEIEELRERVFQAWPILKSAVLNFFTDNGLLWASGLTYTLSLSLVPIMALAFSVAKALGSADRLKPLIANYLTVGSPDLADRLIGFTSNVNAATLGSVGGAFLLFTLISTLSTVENAFNFIWRVPKGRSWLRKFTDYLSVTFTVPLLLTSALTLTASFATRLDRVPLLTWFAPLAMLWAGFFFLFVFFPNTQVKWWAALTGSFFTALLFEVAQRLYVTFQVKASTNAAIYGALAAIPLLLLWIYTAWTVVLFGAELTASIQHGPSEFKVDEPSHTFKRFAVVLIVMRIAERMRNLRGPVTPDSLAKELGITKNALGMTLGNLIKSGLVIEAVEGQDAEDDRGLFLSRDPATITLYDALVEKVESSEREILTHVTVADLVASHQDDGHQRVGNGLGVATQN